MKQTYSVRKAEGYYWIVQDKTCDSIAQCSRGAHANTILRALAYDGRDGRNSRKPKVDWSVIDWSIADADLARKHHVSRERIRQKRVELGKARVPKKPCESRYVNMLRLLETDDMTLDEICKAVGARHDSVRRNLRILGKSYSMARWKSDDFKARLGGVDTSAMTIAEIAAMTKFADSSVRHFLQKLGMEHKALRRPRNGGRA